MGWWSRTVTSRAKSVEDDANEFAVALFRQLGDANENVFFSPFSIRIALAMVLAGARGETAAQMRETLGVSSTDETLHAGIARTMLRLNAGGSGAYEMQVANSLWGQEGSPLEPAFLDVIARHYDGGMNLVDFNREPDTARDAINRWVEDKTRQRIRELIPPGGLNKLTRLVLVNAVYFKGVWMHPFLKEATQVEPYFVERGRTVHASLMRQRKEMRYVHADGFQAVDIPYEGGDVSMLVLLPDQRDGLSDLESSLSEQLMNDCAADMETREVALTLPRFRMSWGTAPLGKTLAALGMPLAFDALRSNFSGINGYVPPDLRALSITEVFHKAFVDVNEIGTEAAAATVLGAVLSSSRGGKPKPIPVFRADHPFLFAIRERRGGAILFLGRVVDPTIS